MRPPLDHDAITELVTTYAEQHHCPTVAWGVVGDGVLAATGSVGDVDEHTVYRIASMTKSFSAAATLWLRDSGVVRLDDPIGLHAPELAHVRSPTADAPPITIRDLLTMTSGLATDDPWADRHLDLTDDEFDAIVRNGLLFAVPTGTIHEYSNFGYAVLGRVVQRASGRRIQDVVSEELLSALGMEATTWTQPLHGEWAPPLDWRDGQFVDELPPLGDGLIAAMGGIWTTVADLARWVTWLDDAYPARDDPDDGPLSRASRREMQTVQRYVGYRTLRGIRCPSGYGYGLRVMDDPELGDVITHSGGVPGYGSNMRWLRGRRTGVIALANSTYAPVTELTARMLALVAQQGFVLDATPPNGELVSSAATQLVALVNQWDDSKADELFADNVRLDESYARRRATAKQFSPITFDRVEIETEASGTAHCTDAEGQAIEISFSLAPIKPPKIQEYELQRLPVSDT
jgi:CubicO group peptidase (beta-lactamase class C family)